MKILTKVAKHLVLICVLLIAALPLQSAQCQESNSQIRARQILEEIDDLWRADSSFSIFNMQVQTKHYTRTVSLQAWSQGKEKSLVRILYPKKEQGTTTLKSGNSIYTYLPKTDRTIRLTSSMMMSSWMGSHFTNDDLVKESRLSEDYDPDLTYEGDRNNLKVIEFSLIPKPEAPVVWGKIVTTITAEQHIPLETLYYDEDMALARTITYDQVKEMSGRLIPCRLKVVPTDEPDEFTILIYEKIDLNIDVDDNIFSLQQLRRK